MAEFQHRGVPGGRSATRYTDTFSGLGALGTVPPVRGPRPVFARSQPELRRHTQEGEGDQTRDGLLACFPFGAVGCPPP